MPIDWTTASRRWIENQLRSSAPSALYLAVTGPLAHLYGYAVRRRNAAFDSPSHAGLRLPGRVVSVGNLVVGGTGKSAVVIALAQRLLARGARPVIVARGYGSALRRGESAVLLGGGVIWRSRPHAPLDAAAMSDEGRMQSAALPTVPIVLGADRAAAAQAYLAQLADRQSPTHWLLDDGFQHRAVARDVDIVLVDARRPLGAGRLLPAGDQREPPSSLRRAHLLIATRSEADGEPVAAAVSRHYTGRIVPATFRTELPTYVRDQHAPSLVVAGIAEPQRFAAAVAGLGVEVGGELFAADHARLMRQAICEASSGCRSVVTTAKDYWRDPTVFSDLPVPVLVADLHVEIDFALVDPLLFA